MVRPIFSPKDKDGFDDAELFDRGSKLNSTDGEKINKRVRSS